MADVGPVLYLPINGMHVVSYILMNKLKTKWPKYQVMMKKRNKHSNLMSDTEIIVAQSQSTLCFFGDRMSPL